jgi:hypothetical protein
MSVICQVLISKNYVLSTLPHILINKGADNMIYNTGYIGEGPYKIRINGKKTTSYIVWEQMIRRCYSSKQQESISKSYVDCEVCEEWHNYQNFAQWYEENYYEVPDQHMQVDKDILIKGNKIYSPDTCVIIPQYINTLFIRNNRKRGQYPVGVYYNKRAKKYEAMYKINGKNKHIGYYTSVDDAFLAYKEYKEDHIKQIADEYFSNGYITEQVYNAMYAWEVESTD